MSRDLIWLACSLLVWGMGEGTFFSFQPLYLQQLGAQPVLIGLVLGAYSFAATLAHIPAGFLADRVGRRPLMWVAWITGLVATVLMALADSLPLFVAGMILYGMTMFVVSPMNSYITAARGSLSVGRALTLISASYNIGAVIGPTLGGWIGENYGYQAIFRTAAGIFLLSNIFIFLIRPQPVETRVSLDPADRLFANSAYPRFLVLFFLASFAMYLPQPLAPNYLQNQRNLDLGAIGQLYSINAIGIVLANLILGQFEHRFAYLLGQATVGLFALILWKETGMAWYSLAFLFLGGYRAARAMASAHVQTLVHRANMGLAYGVTETTSSSANILVPVLAGFLYTRNPDWIFAVALVLIAVSITVNAVFLYLRSSTPHEVIQM
jgi:MFS family permease